MSENSILNTRRSPFDDHTNAYDIDQIDVREESNPDHMESKMKELLKKEKELNDRERNLEEREARLGIRTLPDNWPCKCFALYHHDINLIHEDFRPFIRKLYVVWIATFFCLTYNCIIQIVFWLNGSMNLQQIFWSIIYAICGVPISFRLWYYTHYRSFLEQKKPSTLRFYFGFGIHLVFFGFCACGFSKLGALGVLQITSTNESGIYFILVVIAAVLFCLVLLISIYVFKLAGSFFARQALLQELQETGANIAVNVGVSSYQQQEN